MTKILAAFLTLTLFAVFSTTEAKAQYIVGARGGIPGRTYYQPATATTTPATRVYSYSYYTRSNLPARTYVGYGDNDFPFHGASYGHPYDPWTWPAMSGSYQSGLSRYYAPVLK